MKKCNLIIFVFISFVLVFGASALLAQTSKAPSHPADVANGKVLDPGDIVKDSTRYAGNTVTVRGTVDKIFADGVFTVKEHKLTAVSNLLVIFPNGKMETPIAQGSTFLITGEVRGFSKGDLEAKYGIKGVAPNVVSSFDNKAALIGTSISPSEGNTK